MKKLNSKKWCRVPIVELCEAHVDCVNRTAPIVDSPTPYKMIRTTNVRDGYIDTENVRYVTEETYKKWTRRLIPKRGDVILTREAPLGEVGKIRSGDQIFLGQRLYQFRTNPKKLDADFLLYALLYDDLQGQVRGYGSGATVEHMRLEDIPCLEISLPRIEDQRKIASILSAYDNLIENNLRRIKIMEEMAKNLYREWFVKFRFPGHEHARFIDSPLGMIPEGWEVKKLDQVASFQNNGTVAGEHLRNRVYLPIDCIPRKSLAISEINLWTEAQSSLHLFDSGDILFGAMRPYFHKVVVAPFKGVTRKTCFVFKSRLPEYYAFTVLTLFQESTVSFANAHTKGATIPYAVWPNAMDSMPVIVPQLQQAKQFQDAVGTMIAKIGTMFFQNTNLRLTRDLILPKLISGEVDVSELDITMSDEEAA